MPTFDPNYLAGLPGPIWLIFFLKVLGFVLHLVPMGLWAVALPFSVLAATLLPETSQTGRFGRRMLRQMPIFIALGINFGIVPLLFIQTLYPKPFYTATILIAWHWFIIIPLLLVGYYGVYIVSFAVKAEPGSRQRRLLFPVGIIASLCFLAIGLLIGNGMTLLGHPDRWPEIFMKTQTAAAVSGFGTNMGDPSLWWRLLAMLGLALVTTGIWAMIDACLFADGTKDANVAYRRWAARFAACLATIGVAALGTVQYVRYGLKSIAAASGNRPDALYWDYPFFEYVPYLALLLLVLLFVIAIRGDYGGKLLTAVIAVYTVLLAIFGIIRQIGQHDSIVHAAQMADLTEKTQWTPILLFLVTFVLGVLCIAWIVRQLVLAPPENVAADQQT